MKSFELFLNKSVIAPLIPELCLLLAAIIALVCSISGKQASKAWIYNIPVLVLAFIYNIVVYSVLSSDEQVYLFKGTFVLDSFSVLLKGLILLTILSFNLVAGISLKNREIIAKGEFQFLALTMSLGACFLVSANDLILTFVSLELISLSAIALISIAKNNSLSSEAGIKYLLNGGVASAILLFGFSIIFGIAQGNTLFSTYPDFIKNFNNLELLKTFPFILFSLALFFVVAAFGFKLSLSPFQLWSPDVYEGAPLPVTALMATISKIAAFGIMCRIFFTIFSFHYVFTVIFACLLALMAILSMLYGNLIGLRQFSLSPAKRSLKRLMAYSSMAQMGYIITAVCLVSDIHLERALFYLSAYIVVNLVFFVALIKLDNWHQENNSSVNSDSFEALKGLFKLNPKLGLLMTFCLANLAAILPSLLIAKIILLQSSLSVGLKYLIPSLTLTESQIQLPILSFLSLIMTIVILITSIIGAFYYFSLIKNIFSDNSLTLTNNSSSAKTKRFDFSHLMLNGTLVSLLILSLSFTFNLQFWLQTVSRNSSIALFTTAANGLREAMLEKEIK